MCLDRITYQQADHGFSLESYQVPMGPFEGYNSKEKTWNYYE